MGALQGMRVLDISQFESGPSCAQWLAWYGAEVVKVDLPFAEDGEPPKEDALWLANNHSKKSIAIDLRRPEGQEIFHRLVPKFDAVIENFAFGQAEKMKVDYGTLKTYNPGLIYCTIKGFGLTGPYRGHRALDPIAQASGGAMALTGYTGGTPTRAGFLVGDNASGTTAATGVLAAYVEKLRTGRGQLVEISMQETILHMVRTALLTRSTYPDGVIPRRGNRMTPPTDLYPCAPGGTSDYLMITAHVDRLVFRLFDAMERTELKTDARFRTMDLRRTNGDAVWEEVAAWTRGRTKWEAMDRLAEFGVPASAVFDAADIESNPHLVERGAVVEVKHPVRGTTRVTGSPVRMHGSPITMTAPPLIGEHTREVLAAELGMDDDAIGRLVAGGAARIAT